MTYQFTLALILMFAGPSLAQESYPTEVAEYIEKREICKHFRLEPWPEGSSNEEKERRAFLAAQSERYCKGSDQAIRELKKKYKNNKRVTERLETYEESIEIKQ